jgi:hypothetical protein
MTLAGEHGHQLLADRAEEVSGTSIVISESPDLPPGEAR